MVISYKVAPALICDYKAYRYNFPVIEKNIIILKLKKEFV